MRPANSISTRDDQHSHGSSLRELGAPLDQERAASMADEGGAAGAITDALEQARALPKSDSALSTHRLRSTAARARGLWPWLFAAAAAGFALAWWRRR